MSVIAWWCNAEPCKTRTCDAVTSYSHGVSFQLCSACKRRQHFTAEAGCQDVHNVSNLVCSFQ